MPFVLSDMLPGAIVRHHIRGDKIQESIVVAVSNFTYILIEVEEWQQGFSGEDAIKDRNFHSGNNLSKALVIDRDKKYSWIQLKDVICLTHPIKKDELEELIKRLDL